MLAHVEACTVRDYRTGGASTVFRFFLIVAAAFPSLFNLFCDYVPSPGPSLSQRFGLQAAAVTTQPGVAAGDVAALGQLDRLERHGNFDIVLHAFSRILTQQDIALLGSAHCVELLDADGR